MDTRAREVSEVISRADGLVRRLDERRALYRLAWLALAAVMAALALDAAAQLPALARAGITAAGLVALGFGARALARRRRLRLSEERLARLLEERQPSLDNALINAVQFERQLGGARDAVARQLMEREIQRAEESAGRLDPQAIVDRQAVFAGRRRLAAVGVAFAASVLLMPGLYTSVMPRYLDPFGDHPPFCLTRFLVQPPGARVRYGDSLVINVRTAGQRPRSLSLVTSADGRHWDGSPLFQVRENEYVQKLENIQSDIAFFVQSESGRTPHYRVRVMAAPQVKEVEVGYRYPEYTHRKPTTERLTEAGIQAVPGTRVTLKVASNRVLGNGRLRLALRGEREVRVVPLRPESAESPRGVAAFTVRRSGRFAVDLVGADGLESRDATAGKIALLRDERPLIYVTEPGRPSFATPEVKVPIVLDAEDDFGLRMLRLHRSLNDSQDVPLELALPSSHPRQVTRRAVMDLADLGVRPGDTITYFATAYDTDPARGNHADSEPLWIRVISQAEYERLLRSQTTVAELAAKYRKLLDELRAVSAAQSDLADRTRQLRDKLARSQSPEDLQRSKELATQQRELDRRARELAQEMREAARQKPLFDIEKEFNKRMAALADGLARSAEAMHSAAGQLERAGQGDRAAASAAAALEAQRAALRGLRALGGQAQAVEKALKELQRIYPLYEDLARFVALVEAQGNLVLKAKELERTAPRTPELKARMDELAQWQGQIREALGQIMSDLRQHAKAIEGDHPQLAQQAQAFVGTVESMPIGNHMATAQEAFKRYEGRRGHDEARKALDLLKSLLRRCQSCQQGAGQCLAGFCLGLGMNCGNTLSQLAAGIGFGAGTGSGFGSGMGGTAGFGPEGLSGFGSSPQGFPGMSPADLNLYGPLTPNGSRSSPSGQRRRQPRKLPGPGGEGYLSPSQVEVMPSGRTNPAQAPAAAQERFPPEYKALVREYFRRVSEDAAAGRAGRGGAR